MKKKKERKELLVSCEIKERRQKWMKTPINRRVVAFICQCARVKGKEVDRGKVKHARVGGEGGGRSDTQTHTHNAVGITTIVTESKEERAEGGGGETPTMCGTPNHSRKRNHKKATELIIIIIIIKQSYTS